MQTNTQNTRMHFADRYTKYKHTNTKMYNADKSQNTNTHDSNAKMEAPKGGIELVGHAVVVEYVWNH